MDEQQFNVKLPVRLVEALKCRARKNVRSMTGELTVILTEALEAELKEVEE